MDTYCQSNDGFSPGTGERLNGSLCRGWVLNDTFISSGVVGDSQESVLEMRTFLVRPGLIHFDYKVLAEPFYDGLYFYIDNQMVLDMVSQAMDWTEGSFEIAAGMHTFKWVYFKDYSKETNLDMAMIEEQETWDEGDSMKNTDFTGSILWVKFVVPLHFRVCFFGESLGTIDPLIDVAI